MKVPGFARRAADSSGTATGSLGWWFLPGFALALAISIAPFCYAIVQSLRASKYLEMRQFVGLQNYVDFLSDSSVITNTVVVCVGTLVLSVPLGVGAALALWRATRFQTFFRTLLIIPWLMSSLVAAKLWGWLLSADLGPVAFQLRELGIIMPNPATTPNLAMPLLILAYAWSSFPLIMVMTYAALQAVPKETLEACHVDGASDIQRLFYVVLPIIKNSILVGTILTTINTVNNATMVLVLTGGGPAGATETIALRVFEEGFKFFEVGRGAAGSVVMFIVNAFFVAAYLKTLRAKT
ncbi:MULTISPECIES: carbohydrate ABC transporter permease [unclassified Mesorhizobium]|uniref:carbohydrate ABC transporter permease n=1 Tax=unclassified Mesorhizobium TaxID=325217 RepID=UPI00112E6FA0|nr:MULTISPECIES: sugar ABC transporter permease [unclassified Mesorhizobium]MBZ9811279.1 sugar ABC transporter permease [Mesorhizobium sp. ESP-6-2]TPM25852.1 sugar ABC transporter permease [Mesorhizobium sp. B2-2-2]